MLFKSLMDAKEVGEIRRETLIDKAEGWKLSKTNFTTTSYLLPAVGPNVGAVVAEELGLTDGF